MISVLLAVYNGENFIHEAIRSVIGQSYHDWELIIVDNASTDNTFNIAREYYEVDSRIKLYKLSKKGKCNAYNFAFQKSKGQFFCFLAADDTFTAFNLEERLIAVKGDMKMFSTCLLKTFSTINKYDNLIFPKNIFKPNFSGGSIFFSREIANKIFPIPLSLPNEDTWTSISLKAFATNVHVPKVLYNYRIHDNNSYGYNNEFESKRTMYLNRMNAFILFRERWQKLDNFQFSQYIDSFIEGLNYCKEKKWIKILMVKNLPIKDKIIFVYFSSKLLFRIRNKYFKFFTGLFN